MGIGIKLYQAHRQCRHFSSGIRPIMRALADIAIEEEANQLMKKREELKQQKKNKKKKGAEEGDAGSSSRMAEGAEGEQEEGSSGSAATGSTAELVKGTSKPPQKKDPPAPEPVAAWRTTGNWACMKGCGACCYLDKGSNYPRIEEILEDPKEVALYKSMIGKDGWCKNFNKRTRQCGIFNERPRFCRVEPEIFKELFDIPSRKFEKEACSLCRDSISDVYGCKSKEMKNFERLIASLKK